MVKFSVACPQCRKVYRVDESHTGHTARCRGCSATFVLTKMEGHDVGELIAALGRDLAPDAAPADERSAQRALDALARVGEPAVRPLIAALRHTTHAHEALVRIGGNRVFEALLAELEADDPRRVTAAASALGRMADPRALPALKQHRWSRGHDVRVAVHDAAAAINAIQHEMTEGRWFQVDVEHPHEQVLRVRWQLDHILHDPVLRQRALRWHRDFCATMPRISFASDDKRAETWHLLGTLIFQLLNPDKPLEFANGEPPTGCPEAAYCFAQSSKHQA